MQNLVTDWVEILDVTLAGGTSAYNSDFFTVQPGRFAFAVDYTKGGETSVSLNQIDIVGPDGTEFRLLQNDGAATDYNAALVYTATDKFVVELFDDTNLGTSAGAPHPVRLFGRTARLRVTVQGTPNGAGSLTIHVGWVVGG